MIPKIVDRTAEVTALEFDEFDPDDMVCDPQFGSRPLCPLVDRPDVETALLQGMRNLCGNGTPSFSLVVNDDGVIRSREYKDRPCWGELKGYQIDDDDSQPSDLVNDFPAGNPVGILTLMYDLPVIDDQLKYPLVWDTKTSPWKQVVQDVQIFKVEYYGTTHYFGWYTNLEFDPTQFVNFQLSRSIMHDNVKFDRWIEAGATPQEALVLGIFYPIVESGESARGTTQHNNTIMKYDFSYTFSDFNPKLFLEQKPNTIVSKTFANRGMYCRPRMACVFATDPSTYAGNNSSFYNALEKGVKFGTGWEKKLSSSEDLEIACKTIISNLREYMKGL